jgi:putative DNA primase/helicase
VHPEDESPFPGDEHAPTLTNGKRAPRRSKAARVARADDDARPILEIGVDEERVTDAAIDALAGEERLFRRGTALVRMLPCAPLPVGLVHREGDPATIATLPHETLSEWLASRACVLAPNKRGVLRPARPPSWLVRAIEARQDWPTLRHLEAMVETSVLLPSGAILDRPGYDPTSGLYLAAEPTGVPDRPTGADVRAALDVLARLVSDFPFRAPEHRAAWLALVLTPLARFAFAGAAPMFVIDASAAGTGKTLLAAIACVIATGRALALDALPTDRDRVDDSELRKSILSWALSGRRVIGLDNVDGVALEGAELARAITATKVGGRVLGASRDWTGPMFATWIATGNNVEIGGDMHRRVAHVRLEARCERPEERTGFAIADLEEHVRQHRATLTGAALTLLRAYCVAGRPDQRLPEWGSFAGWSAIVRGAIVWAGWPDPFVTRNEMRVASTTRAGAERAAIVAWVRVCATVGRTQGLTVREALTFLGADGAESHAGAAELRAALEELAGGLDATAVGRVLRGLRRRVVTDEGRSIAIDVLSTAKGGAARWGPARLEGDPGGDGAHG